jgi:hypothetical protein
MEEMKTAGNGRQCRSSSNRPIKLGITLQTCRLFRYKPATYSGLNLPGIPL